MAKMDILAMHPPGRFMLQINSHYALSLKAPRLQGDTVRRGLTQSGVRCTTAVQPLVGSCSFNIKPVASSVFRVKA